MHALVRILYDGACRIQDCIDLPVKEFIAQFARYGTANPPPLIIKLCAKKTKARDAIISTAGLIAVAKHLDGRKTGYVFQRINGDSETEDALSKRIKRYFDRR